MQLIRPNENECCVWIFSAKGLPDGLSIDTFSGKITGRIAKAGIFNVKVTVCDGTDSTSIMFVWKVEESASQLPVITNPGDRHNKAGDEVMLQIVAKDAEDEALTFSADGLPDGLLIDTNIGRIMGKLIKPGDYLVKITVSDGISSVSVRFNWKVERHSSDARLPLIVNPGDQTNRVGDDIVL